MKNLLILYPIGFKCQSKFDRKVSKITSNMKEFSVVFPDDVNNFITDYFSILFPDIILIRNADWKGIEISNAIVFDDGEEFTEELEYIKSIGAPLRLIEISITRVVNIQKETIYKTVKSTPSYEYIGRGSYWGNPYSMYEAGEDRDEVIRKYKYDFDYEKFPNKNKSEVYKLTGKRLGCFCKPESCHGDILADYLNGFDDGK